MSKNLNKFSVEPTFQQDIQPMTVDQIKIKKDQPFTIKVQLIGYTTRDEFESSGPEEFARLIRFAIHLQFLYKHSLIIISIEKAKFVITS